MKTHTNHKELGNMYHIWKMVILILLLGSSLSACNPSQAKPSIPVFVANQTVAPVVIPTITPTPVLLGEYRLLSPEDMRFDLDELFRRLEAKHPDPYAKRSKAEVDLERQRIYEEFDRPMTTVDFYKKVKPLINSLGDYHTRVYLPDDTVKTIVGSELTLPFAVQMEGEHAYIISNASEENEIKLGTELLEINGISTSHLFHESTPNFLQGLIIRETDFWFLFGSFRHYQVKVLPPGETDPLVFTIPSVSVKAIDQQYTAMQYPQPLIYTKLPDEAIGVLTINTFQNEVISYLKPAFTQIQQDEIENLIIDIRSNRGGMYWQVDAIMKYLTDQTYRACSQYSEAPEEGNISAGPKKFDCDTKKPADTPLRFQGHLFLLVGPDTFSAAITFATILQDYGLAPLIGEETVDSASYCALMKPGVLPRTRILFRSSTACYVRPNGVFDDRHLIPDTTVKTTINDLLTGTDPVLEYTIETIRKSNLTP